MKNFFLILFFLPQFLFSQVFDGQWQGTIQGLEMFIDVSEKDNVVMLTVPMQGVVDLKADNAEMDSERIDFYFKPFGATFYGKNVDGKIEGTWSQAGKSNDLVFEKSDKKPSFNRPQTPTEPFSYDSEDITFINAVDDIKLAGTLTTPKGDGPFPAVILISGSGPQNRDSDLFKHKIFFVLADYFTNRGYAVLRYDDRGIGQSKGKFRGATSMDFSYDAEAAFKYLQKHNKINSSKIGFMGHSEGGIIAPMVAARNNDVGFMVLLAGPGIPSVDVLSFQLKNSYHKMDISEDAKNKSSKFVDDMLVVLSNDGPNDKIIDQFRTLIDAFYGSLSAEDQKHFGGSDNDLYFSLAPGFLDPWMRYFLKYDPRITLEKINSIPVLAANGSTDQQVIAKSNLKGIKKSLKSAGNKNFKTKCFKNLNHLFQYSKTGNPTEYATIEETFNVEVLTFIGDWLDKEVK